MDEPPPGPLRDSIRVVPTGPAARRERYLTAVLQAQLQLLRHGAGRAAFPDVMRIIGEAAGACRAFYFENELGADGRLYLTQQVEWCAPGVAPTLESGAFSMLAYDDFLPFWREILRPEASFGSAVEAFPEPARSLLLRHGVQAFLVFPLFAGERFSGFIGFVNTLRGDGLTEVEADLLKGTATAMEFALERQSAEEQLAHERDVLVTVLRSIAEAVLVVNGDERVVMANAAALQMLGLPEQQVLGERLGSLFVVHEAEGKEAARPCIAQRAIQDHARVDRLEPGILRTQRDRHQLVLESATPLAGVDPVGEGALVVMRDVTSQVQAWRELDNARRLESIGILAGGIAHNFNNLLMAIVGHVGLARLAAKENPDVDKWLTKAENAVKRGRDLTGKMMTFAAGGNPACVATDLAPIVRAAIQQAEHERPHGVRFLVEEAVQSPVEPALLEQAVHHVISNALMASAESQRPVEVRLTQAQHEESGEVRALIEVVDHGIGIPKEVRARVFEPFFSTHSGRTGLGLATARSIINRHQGNIEIDEPPGSFGTQVRIWLPLAETEKEALSEAPLREPPSGEPVAAGEKGSGVGDRRVLVLEDDATLRILLESMLDRFGFEASGVADAEAFLATHRAARQEGRPFVLSIVDLTLEPGMGGLEAVAALHREEPEARCVVASGYSHDPAMLEPCQFGFVARLRKPFTVDSLRVMLRSIGFSCPD